MQKVIIDNRYRILKKCGTGATGTVYKVRDLKDKRIIALKMLSKKKTSSEAVKRFKREFKLLSGLRHPNLCSVYNFGTLGDGRSYFTMEYIDGPDIFEFTKKLPYEKIYPVRKDISNGVYPLIVQLCRVLEYIHSKGLIHYDIKPGNVLIQESSDNVVVKLTDFGLAGEHRIKGGALIRGTFPYIAPEIIKGLAVDHRADLYSLGVLLYEIFTRRSFQEGRESFATLLKQRIDSISEPPSKIVSDIPKLLERLIVRLLAFEPAARFSHVNEIIKEINKLSRLKFEFETEKTLESYLLSSKFVGREKEMGVLKSLYEEVRKGKGKVVLVTGEAGIGKSRLLKEFKIFTQLKRSHCFIGYAYKDKIGPLEPFYDIFSELINYISDASFQSWPRGLKTSLAVLFKIFPDLTDGHLRRNLPRLTLLEPKQEKLRNFEALSELIGYCASSLGELVILLEDLHWADDLSIQFLEYLARNLEDKNIIICGTSRNEELEENRVLRAMVSNLKNEGYFDQIELTPLKFRSLYSFLDSTITHGSNSPELVRYLMKKTGGNPFFVEEIMRTLLRTKKVSIGEKMETKDLKQIAIPGTIEDVVLKRIKDLDHTSQKVMKFAAILLRSFSYDLMKRLTSFDDTELSRALWELKNKQVLIEEDNEYRFYHATLREAINKRMAYREKRKLYYQTGKTLELIYKRNIEGVVEDLAYYFINAKDSKKGIKYGLRAARKSSERYANEQAIQFYKGVLSLLGEKNPKLCFNLLQKKAQIEYLAGYHEDAIKTYSKVLSIRTGTLNKKIKINFGIGKIYESVGEYNNALHIYKRVKRLVKKMKPGGLKDLLEAYTNVRICSACQKIGDYKSVDKFNFNVVKFPKEGLKGREAIRLLAGMYNTMGIIEYQKMNYSKVDYDRAISYYKEAYRFYKKIKAETGIAAVPTNLGLCYYWKSDFQKAIDCYQKSIRTSEKTGNQYSVSINLFNLGLILVETGCYLKALDYFQRAISISKKVGNHLVTGSSLGQQGWCFLRLCDYKRAKEYFEKASKIFDTMGLKRRKTYQIVGIGEIYQAIGNYTLALRFYRKALKIFRDRKIEYSIVELLIEISSVFTEIGEFSKATKYVEHALKTVTSVGANIYEVECYLVLCQIRIMMRDYGAANDYYKKGIKVAKELRLRQHVLQFLLLVSEIYYHEKKYRKGMNIANKSLKRAKEMKTKDLYVKALLIKTKYEIKQGVLSKIEIIKFLDEAKRIAEEIGSPEVLWKVYFDYGRFFQDDKQYLRALKYYRKCNIIFGDICKKIKRESYKKSYLSRPDRESVITFANEIEKLLD